MTNYLATQQARVNRAAGIAREALAEVGEIGGTLAVDLKQLGRGTGVGEFGDAIRGFRYNCRKVGERCMDDTAPVELYGYGCELVAMAEELGR